MSAKKCRREDRPLVRRLSENPLIKPEDVRPSEEELEVVCTFNPGVAQVDGETLLLIRVAERPVEEAGYVGVPVLDTGSDTPRIKVLRFKREEVDTSDPRAVVHKGRKECYLSTISHLRVARSKDGVHFEVDPEPAIRPTEPWEEYGVEDPRITRIDGTYYITYVAVSRHGIATALATTKDFRSFEKHGIIFPPANRDVALFPEPIGGKFVTLHRPFPVYIGKPSMWLAYSPDLIHWDEHLFLMAPREGRWDSERIGGGTVPLKTEEGWLEIYHGVHPEKGYCLGAVLLDLERPHKVIARSEEPILAPEEDYETKGFFDRVVFTCGALLIDGRRLRIYYGAADRVVACAEADLLELLDSLRN